MFVNARPNTLTYSYFHEIEYSWNVMSVDIRTAHCTRSFEFKVEKFIMDKS